MTSSLWLCVGGLVAALSQPLAFDGAAASANAPVADPRGEPQESGPPDHEDRISVCQQEVFRAALRAVAGSIVRIDTIGGAAPRVAQDGAAAHLSEAGSFRQADGPTTGLIWTADGYVITSSFNFLRDPSITLVTLHDGRRFLARLIARDRPARLALLKIDAADLPVPRLVARAELRAGQWALSAGLGHGGTTPTPAVGVLSALDRMGGLAVQTDAKTSPANYGGPLFDILGRVIGVCVPLGPGEQEVAGVEWYDSGIGFAIHADHISQRIARLMQGQDVRRGRLGVTLDGRQAPAGNTDAWPDDPDSPPPAADGIRIVEDPEGPAAEAGLRRDDVITHIDGLPTPRIVDLRRALTRKAAGDSVEVTYRRREQVLRATLTLASEEELAASTSQPAP